MRGTKNRNIKILGAAWLVGGGIAFAIVVLALFQLALNPSATEAEGGLVQGLVFVLALLVLGTIGIVNGLALLRRSPIARPLIAISSLVLLIPSGMGLASVATRGDPTSVIALLVVVASLWLTLSRGGKEALGRYMARESG